MTPHERQQLEEINDLIDEAFSEESLRRRLIQVVQQYFPNTNVTWAWISDIILGVFRDNINKILGAEWSRGNRITVKEALEEALCHLKQVLQKIEVSNAGCEKNLQSELFN